MAKAVKQTPRLKPLQVVAIRVAVGLIKLLAWTLKVDSAGWEHVETAMKSGRPMILATWHSNIVAFFTIRLRAQLPFAIVMISQSRDGDLATAVLDRLGGTGIRGSSSRGGARAVLSFKRAIQKERDSVRAVTGVHLLDGPRGPRKEIKPGIVAMARLTHALIVPMLAGSEPCRKFRSWDRHFVPLPFARLHFRFGPPVDLGGTESGSRERDSSVSRLSDETAVERIRQAMFSLEQSDPVIAASLSEDPPGNSTASGAAQQDVAPDRSSGH